MENLNIKIKRLVQVPGIRVIILFGLVGLFILICVFLTHNYKKVPSDLADVKDLSVTDMVTKRDRYFSNRLGNDLLKYFVNNSPESEKIKMSTSEMIIIEDKFPQGSKHFLCLPKKESIRGGI